MHRHKRPSSYFQNEGNCTLSVWPMWQSNWNPSMCNTKICIQIFNLLQLNYLTSQQCCDSENESWNMRVKNTVEIV